MESILFLNDIINQHKDYYAFAYIGKPSVEFLTYFIQGLRNRNNHQPNVNDYWAIYVISEQSESELEDFKKSLRENKIYNDVICISRPSNEAISLFRDRYFDMIFLYDLSALIDKDIGPWLSKLNTGKMICGFDRSIFDGFSLSNLGDVWYTIKE